MADDGTPDGYVPFDPDNNRTTVVIRTLTRIGILLYIAWALWLFRQLYRASQVTSGVSAGLWEQRVEALAFIGFVPNLPALALPAAAAAVATWMAGPTQQIELAILLRLIRWTANALIVLATISVWFAIFGVSGGPDEVGTIAFRAAGAIGAFAISTFCREAGRNSPGG